METGRVSIGCQRLPFRLCGFPCVKLAVVDKMLGTFAVIPKTDAFARVTIISDINTDGSAFWIVEFPDCAHTYDAATACGFRISHKVQRLKFVAHA